MPMCKMGTRGLPNSGLWSDSKLVITPTSLGAIKVGMSLDEVNAAAGVNVNISGDGVYDSTQMPPDSLHLYIQGKTVRKRRDKPAWRRRWKSSTSKE